MATMNIHPQDQARIDKLGLLVSMHGPSYVVRHPLLKRQRFEAGNLSAIIASAEMALDTYVKKTESSGKLPGLKGTKKTAKPGGAGEGKTVAQAVAESPKHEPGEEPDDTIHPNGATAASVVTAQKTTDPKPKKTRVVAKPKRAQSDWKTYAVGHLILTNPDKTPDEIMTMCKAAGVETKLMTVVGLTRYFRLCTRIMADIAEAKAADAQL